MAFSTLPFGCWRGTRAAGVDASAFPHHPGPCSSRRVYMIADKARERDSWSDAKVAAGDEGAALTSNPTTLAADRSTCMQKAGFVFPFSCWLRKGARTARGRRSQKPLTREHPGTPRPCPDSRIRPPRSLRRMLARPRGGRGAGGGATTKKQKLRTDV